MSWNQFHPSREEWQRIGNLNATSLALGKTSKFTNIDIEHPTKVWELISKFREEGYISKVTDCHFSTNQVDGTIKILSMALYGRRYRILISNQ